MTVLTLGYPVRTLDGVELVSGGIPLTGEVLEKVAAAGRRKVVPESSLLEYGNIRRDILASAREGTYAVMLGRPGDAVDLGLLMNKTRLPLPLLHSLDYFRRKDPYTYRHILMVFALSSLIARHLMASFNDVLRHASAGPLHDVGKICVPLEVLKKTTCLKRSERNVLEHHTMAGYVLLAYYLGDAAAANAEVARDHHERNDGSGYPRGIRLSGTLKEIVAACDVYDALISPRPYRKSCYDNRTALEEITRMGEQGKINWDVVRLLVALNRRDRPDPGTCQVSLEKRGKPPEGNLYGVVVDDDPPPKRNG